jgi:hypothetical protein
MASFRSLDSGPPTGDTQCADYYPSFGRSSIIKATACDADPASAKRIRARPSAPPSPAPAPPNFQLSHRPCLIPAPTPPPLYHIDYYTPTLPPHHQLLGQPWHSRHRPTRSCLRRLLDSGHLFHHALFPRQASSLMRVSISERNFKKRVGLVTLSRTPSIFALARSLPIRSSPSLTSPLSSTRLPSNVPTKSTPSLICRCQQWPRLETRTQSSFQMKSSKRTYTVQKSSSELYRSKRRKSHHDCTFEVG